MTGDQIVTLLIGIFGGGVGAAIVSAIANRKKVHAEATMTLSEGYETRIEKLTNRTCTLESQVEQLQGQVIGLKSVLSEREATIINLQAENTTLQKQVDKLVNENKSKDRKIDQLSKRVKELEERLNAISADDSANPAGWTGGTD